MVDGVRREPERLTVGELLSNWKEAILTCNCHSTRMDGVTKWLVLTRACVFSMTFFSGLIGLLLAAGSPTFQPGYALLAVLGITLAHASNNLINDYFDLAVGLDSSEDYVRAQYAPHPLLSGLATRRDVIIGILLINLIDLAIMVYLALTVGPLVIAFALAGLFISVFYTVPPIRLKRIGLGEPSVLIIWGPLMTGGTYYVATGTLPLWALIATLPYALIVTAVLMGKHIDKIEKDRPKGIHTLPVLLGEKPALRLTQALITLFYPIVIGLVLTGYVGVWALLVVLSIPLYIETMALLNRPRPAEPPENYPVWPLWYVSVAFRMTRAAGGALILGLVLNRIFPLAINLF